MRLIQIEGQEENYLMDPEGNIFDMQANYIGKTNIENLEI